MQTQPSHPEICTYLSKQRGNRVINFEAVMFQLIWIRKGEQLRRIRKQYPF